MNQLKQTILKIEVQLTLSNPTCTAREIVGIDRVSDYTMQKKPRKRSKENENEHRVTQ